MKTRNYILILTMVFGYLSNAQNVPNGGFENWETEDHYVLDEWVTYGRAERTSDASQNDYALKLSNYTDVSGNVVSSSLYNVDWANATVDKFPYDGDPLSMVFDTKHDLAEGDTGYFFSGFYEKGQYIGQALILVSGSTDDKYVTYSVPITWYSLSRTPDSVFIGVLSDLRNDPKGDGYLIIDDFRFENIGKRTTEINNYDFEDWSNKGVVYPKEFISLDLVAYRNWGGFLPNPSVSRDSGAFRGSSCLKVSNFVNWDQSIAEGSCFTGDTLPDAWGPAFPVNQKYKYLQGYYKFEKGNNDVAEISVNMYLLGSVFADGTLKISEASDDWVFFNLPVNYYVDLVPDSATIRIASATDLLDNSVNTALYIDELKFVNELENKVSVSERFEINPKVYPNPFENRLVVEAKGGDFTISDINGKSIQSGVLNNGKTYLTMTSLPTGIYILTIINQDKTLWHKKIIK